MITGTGIVEFDTSDHKPQYFQIYGRDKSLTAYWWNSKRGWIPAFNGLQRYYSRYKSRESAQKVLNSIPRRI